MTMVVTRKVNRISEYFQKSQMLFPLTGITRSKHKYLETYTALEGTIDHGDKYLVVEWDKDTDTDFMNKRVLCQSLLHSTFEHEDRIYTVFDMSSWATDWEHFMEAKYSKLSDKAKKLILNYYNGTTSLAWIESYLYPEYYQVQYKKLLNVNMKLLKYVGQLCDPPDIERETLKIRT